ncbi:MAG TPA: amino acid ABC transporter permease, partial [Clostridia bacterium]|nr:amino acid ABC transporter permease [Clostridia bacterium]
TTLVTALFAGIIGLILGSVIALMRLSSFRIGRFYPFRILSTFYVDLIRGTPVVVQLMIIYHIIMANYFGPKVVVAIISFGINSGAYVSEMVRGGILAIDQGQTEAGRSLGLSKSSTMLLIVMPQALKIIIPTLFNEFIMLLKETSVVGFIGLMDLTKAGDYIRSRTFSAFFPLIMVALIYYVMITLLTRVFAVVERRLRKSDQHSSAL